jgi:hypothetical protein
MLVLLVGRKLRGSGSPARCRAVRQQAPRGTAWAELPGDRCCPVVYLFVARSRGISQSTRPLPLDGVGSGRLV